MLDVETLKAETTLSAVVTEFSGAQLKSAGHGRWKTLCLFHSEKTPSMHINDTEGFFHCFGCGESGDSVSFVSKLLSIDFVDAVTSIAERFNVAVGTPGTADQSPESVMRAAIYQANAAAEQAFAAALRDPNTANIDAAYDFMRGKHLTYQVTAPYGIGYAPGARWLYTRLKKDFDDETLLAAGLIRKTQYGLRDAFHRRLIFSLRDQRGRVVGFNARKLNPDDGGGKYINTESTLVYNKSTHLYGIDIAKDSIRSTGTAIIVEGSTDHLAFAHAGITNVVAACGTAFGRGHLATLRSITGDKPLTVLYIGDGDAAGAKAATRLWNELRNQPVALRGYTIVDNGHGTDPNDLLINGGTEALQTIPTRSEPLAQLLIDQRLRPFSDADATPEQLSEATTSALEVLDGWTDAVAVSQYRRRIADTVGIDESALPAPERPKPSQTRTPPQSDGTAREALRMLAQHADCAPILAAIPSAAFPNQRDKDLHHYLWTLREQHPHEPLHQVLDSAPHSPLRTEGFRVLMEPVALAESVPPIDYAVSLALMLEERAHTSIAATHLAAVRQAHTPEEQRAALQKMLSSQKERAR